MRLWVLLAFVLALAALFPVLAQEEEMASEEPPEEVAEESPPPDPTQVPTPRPLATARAAPVPGDILLSDNFDDPTRAQLPLSSTESDQSQGYVGGEYEFVNGRSERGSAQDLNIPGQFSNTSISVDVRVLGGITVRRGAHLACAALPAVRATSSALTRTNRGSFSFGGSRMPSQQHCSTSARWRPSARARR